MAIPNQDLHENRKLHRLTKLYGLPYVLNEKAVVVESTSNLDIYQTLILPTHALSSNISGQQVSNGDYLDMGLNDDLNSGLNNNDNDLDSYNDNNNNNNAGSFNDFDINDDFGSHNDNTNDFDGVNDDSTTNTSNLNDDTAALSALKLKNSIVLIGHGIYNNGGVPINNLSKIPSYQWGFRHEDETSQIMNSLYSRDGCSISLLAGNMPNINSAGLNSRMIRLPIKNKNPANINPYDLDNGLRLNETIVQGGHARSLMNGLPYFDIEMAEKMIRQLNMEKKDGFKASNTNTSWFSDTVNETIDDIEYLHGEVILNQFVNNKRVIRNYDWLLYWDEKIGGKKLIDSVRLRHGNAYGDVMTFKTYEKLLNFRHKKFEKLQEKKLSIKQEIAKLDTLKAEKRNEYREKFGSLPHTIDAKNTEVYGEELFNQYEELTKKENEIPESEEEVEVTLHELEEYNEAEDSEDAVPAPTQATEMSAVDIVQSSRFGGDPEFNKEQEVVIEKEFQINDPALLNIQNKLYGTIKSLKLQNEAKSRPGIITSKIVKIKRQPNPNALGFSNIRSRKPSFI